MIITYLRSSSYNQHTLCPHSYLLTYVLGIRPPAGKAAAKGNVVHKALETLAWQSYHRARGNVAYDDETFGPLILDRITPEGACDRAYAHYKAAEPHLKWWPADLRDCQDWTRLAIECSNGYFDPRNLDVIQPEQRFDFTIDEPWARYDFATPDGPVQGQLGLKGTMDLVVRDKADPRVIEVIDWKTGARKDWATGEVKDFAKLSQDPQLLLYYYACCRLFPAAEHIAFTIVYVKDGGPFRLYFGPEHREQAEGLIRRKFEAVRDTQVPVLKKGPPCWTFCWFGKNNHPSDPSKTYCEFFAERVRRDGLDAVTREFGKPNAYAEYGDGGGRKAGDG